MNGCKVALLSILVFVLSGCAPKYIQRSTVVLSSNDYVRDTKTNKIKRFVNWSLKKDGFHVTVTKRSICAEVSGVREKRQRVTKRTPNAQNYYLVGTAVLAGAVIGSVMMVVPPDEPGLSTRQIQEREASADILGVTLIVAGAAIGVAVLVGTLASGITTKGKPYEVSTDKRRRLFKCGPISGEEGVQVGLRFNNQVIGGSAKTNSRGKAFFPVSIEQLSRMSSSDASSGELLVAQVPVEIDVKQHRVYLSAVAWRERERLKRERQRRAALEAELVKKMMNANVRVMKRPKRVYLNKRVSACSLPTAVCDGQDPIQKGEPVDIIATKGKFVGIMKPGAKAPFGLRSIQGFIFKTSTESKLKYQARLRREKRAEAARKRKELARIRRKAARLRVLAARERKVCAGLRRKIRASFNCKLVIRLVKAGYTFPSSLKVALGLDSALRRLTSAKYGQRAKSLSWLVVCRMRNGRRMSYVGHLMAIEKGATEENLRIMAACAISQYGRGNGGLVFARVLGTRVTLGVAIFDIYSKMVP